MIETQPEKSNNKEIKFYRANENYGFLSNFSPHQITIKGKRWRTVEHYYQAQKFAGTIQEDVIHKALTPGSAKKLGNDRNSAPLRKDWSNVKEHVMYEALLAKFTQHENLREKLLSTGNAILIEHSNKDCYWGDGGNGKGLNRLGALLMHVRYQLRENKSSDAVEKILDSPIIEESNVENQVIHPEFQPEFSESDDGSISEGIGGEQTNEIVVATGPSRPTSAQKAIKKKNKNRMRKNIWKDQTGGSLFEVDNEVRGQVSLVNQGIKVPVSVLPHEAKHVIRQNQYRRRYIKDSDDDVEIGNNSEDDTEEYNAYKPPRRTLGDYLGVNSNTQEEISHDQSYPEYLLSPQRCISTAFENITLLEELSPSDASFLEVLNNLKEIKQVLIQFIEQPQEDSVLSQLLSIVEKINELDMKVVS